MSGLLEALGARFDREPDEQSYPPESPVLRPLFGLYGAKWRLAGRLPSPEHDDVVEPFAGSAGYSLSRTSRNQTGELRTVRGGRGKVE
jgi:hypothetical protein